MAQQIQDYIRRQMPLWKDRYPGVEEMNVAVMGCVVNGPGESKHSNIGISLPGTFEEPKAPVFVDGRLLTTLRGERIVAVGLLTRQDLSLLGPAFDRAWPVEEAPSFNELLRAIDEADRKLQRADAPQRH